MTPLPIADPVLRELFLHWLETFSGHVRRVDYAAARPLWHPDVVTFGTHRDLVRGVEATVATQWDNVWPKTADFAFDLERTEILAAPDGAMAVVIAPWTSTGFAPDGAPFERPGRATIVLQNTDEGWRVAHTHMSLNKGVPQSSHGDRPHAA